MDNEKKEMQKEKKRNIKYIFSHIIVFASGMLVMLIVAIFVSFQSPFIVNDTLSFIVDIISSNDSAIEKLEKATTEEDRFYALGDAGKEAFAQENYVNAESYAVELEKLTPKYKKNWNYGNAIQDYNIVFGLIALKDGNLKKANEHLILAGESPGSPQMDTFGPNMLLAQALLEKGEKDTVVKYLESCKTFWEMDRGRLDNWILIVKGGGIPSFGANLEY